MPFDVGINVFFYKNKLREGVSSSKYPFFKTSLRLLDYYMCNQKRIYLSVELLCASRAIKNNQPFAWLSLNANLPQNRKIVEVIWVIL